MVFLANAWKAFKFNYSEMNRVHRRICDLWLSARCDDDTCGRAHIVSMHRFRRLGIDNFCNQRGLRTRFPLRADTRTMGDIELVVTRVWIMIFAIKQSKCRPFFFSFSARMMPSQQPGKTHRDQDTQANIQTKMIHAQCERSFYLVLILLPAHTVSGKIRNVKAIF